VKRVFLPLALLLLAPGGRAEDEDPPLIFFRQPDRQTRKEIVHAVSSKGLGSSTREVRRQTRARLVEIGPWAVPFLSATLTTGTENIRVRMNAAITLAWIRDRTAIPALNTGAEKDKNLFVRRTSCLALGKFREPEALERVLKTRGGAKAAAALALAKCSDTDEDLYVARREIGAAAEAVPDDPHYAAAILVAATLLGKDPKILDQLLGHKDKLLRRAAVTCRLIRPLPPTRVELLEKRLAVERDPGIRALLYHALGAVGAKNRNEILLDAATKTKEKKPARIAAAIELARRCSVQGNYKDLWGAYQKNHSRNDPVVGPLLFALAQTGHPKALKELERIMRMPEAGLRSFYAAGSLFYFACHGALKDADAKQLLNRIADTNPKERWLKALTEIVKPVRWMDDRAVWWQEALAGDEEKSRTSLRKLRLAGLWTMSNEERAWAKLNLLLPYIFELDDIVDTRDMSEQASTEPAKGQGATDDSGGDGDTHDDGSGGEGGGIPAGVGKQGPSGGAEELDLIDFLKDPYFVPEDLRGG
jgi:HEAT repeat protein